MVIRNCQRDRVWPDVAAIKAGLIQGQALDPARVVAAVVDLGWRDGRIPGGIQINREVLTHGRTWRHVLHNHSLVGRAAVAEGHNLQQPVDRA